MSSSDSVNPDMGASSLPEPSARASVDQVREHEFDGIEEFDNRLPNWWLWTFYGACIFSLFYWLHFHVIGSGSSPEEDYQQSLQAYLDSRPKEPMSEERILAYVDNAAAMAEAKAEFQKPNQCMMCHGLNGEGNTIGPNLTDDYWLHGDDPMSIYTTISKGVVEKGMLAWEGTLSEDAMAKLAAYIHGTLRGTNVAGGRAPQGELRKD